MSSVDRNSFSTFINWFAFMMFIRLDFKSNILGHEFPNKLLLSLQLFFFSSSLSCSLNVITHHTRKMKKEEVRIEFALNRFENEKSRGVTKQLENSIVGQRKKATKFICDIIGSQWISSSHGVNRFI